MNDAARPLTTAEGARWTVKVMARNAVRSLVIATAICLLPDCSSAQQPRANAEPLFAGKNVLVVYLSRTNNTKAIAEFIHQRVGGSIVAVEVETPYPADYDATVQQVPGRMRRAICRR